MNHRLNLFLILVGIVTIVAFAADTPVPNPKLTGTADFSRVTNTTEVRDTIAPIADLAHAVDRRLIGQNPSTARALFSAINHSSPAYTRSTTSWAASINLTSVSVWNSVTAAQGAGTLVSPRHIIFAEHFNGATGSNPWPNGTTLRFVTADNVIVTRTLTAKQRVGSTDICVGLLDSDVPATIGFARVLPANYSSFFSVVGLPLLYSDQEKKAHVADVQSNGSLISIEQSADSTRSTFYETVITGDSGSPIFLVIGNQPILVATFTNPATGASIDANLAAVNSAMTSLGGAYQLTPIDPALLVATKVAWANLTGKPAFTSTATTVSSISPTAGQIPLVRNDTNKLDVAIIPAVTAAAVEWTDVQNRPFTLATTGGNGAADAGKALLFDMNGDITPTNIRLPASGGNPGIGNIEASLVAISSGEGDVLPLVVTGTGASSPGIWPVFAFIGDGAATTDWIGSFGRAGGENMAVKGNGSLEWSTRTARKTTRENLDILTRYKSGDTTRTSNTTPAADPDLTFPMPANSVWRVKMEVYFSVESNTPGFKCGPNGPASPTFMRWRMQRYINENTLFGNFASTAYNTAVNFSANMGDFHRITMEGTFFNGANAGNFTFDWSQDTTSADDTTLLRGSYLEAIRLD